MMVVVMLIAILLTVMMMMMMATTTMMFVIIKTAFCMQQLIMRTIKFIYTSFIPSAPLPDFIHNPT